MEKGDLTGPILKQDGALIARKSEAPVDREFNLQFQDEFGRLILLKTAHIPPTTGTQTRQYEGSVGYLPSPAKRVVVRDILSGRPVTPLRVYEEVETGEPERQVETATVHLIVSVDPITVADSAEIEAATNTIAAVYGLPKNNAVLTTDDKEVEPVRINKVKVVLHLVRRNILGDYSLENMPIGTHAQLEAAFAAYRKSLEDSLKYFPGTKPDKNFVANAVICAGLARDMGSEQGPNSISLPVVVNPKSYSAQTAGYDSEVSVTDLFARLDPFVLVSSLRKPELGEFVPLDQQYNFGRVYQKM